MIFVETVSIHFNPNLVSKEIYTTLIGDVEFRLMTTGMCKDPSRIMKDQLETRPQSLANGRPET